MANYGVSVSYKGKRYVLGNHTNYFGDFTKPDATRLAKNFNIIAKKGHTIIKNPKAKPIIIEHGAIYSCIEAYMNKLKIINRKHAG